MDAATTPRSKDAATTPRSTDAATTPRSREARRRRIVERGSDRLALISGRIKTLPSEPESPGAGSPYPRGHNYTASCPPQMTQSQLSNVNAYSDSQDLLQNEGNTPNVAEKIMTRSLVQPYMRKSDISSEASYKATTTIDNDSKGQATEVMPTIQSPPISSSDDPSHHSETSLIHQTSALTFPRVSAAFTATESARLHCSLAVAVSVVLSYIGFPILGSRFLGSVILFRPLFLLLLTNITVAMSQLLEKQQQNGGQHKPEGHGTPSVQPSVKGMADHIGSALEIGLTLQNVTGALILDCSIYAVIVICGLSLAQTFGL